VTTTTQPCCIVSQTNAPLLGAVGQLKFGAVAVRLAGEWKIGASCRPACKATARWTAFASGTVRRRFEREHTSALARAVNDYPAFFPTSE
jgi:peptide subunit release factor RF-3